MFLIKHTCVPAVISLCLAIPWQQIAYHRKLEWRAYLVWISLLHCLIPHSVFHSMSASFCRNTLWLHTGTDKCVGIVYLQTHLIDFSGALWPASPHPQHFISGLRCTSYSVKNGRLMGLYVSQVCTPRILFTVGQVPVVRWLLSFIAMMHRCLSGILSPSPFNADHLSIKINKQKQKIARKGGLREQRKFHISCCWI